MFLFIKNNIFLYIFINIFLLNINFSQASDTIEKNAYYKIKNLGNEKVLNVHRAHLGGDQVTVADNDNNHDSQQLFSLRLIAQKGNICETGGYAYDIKHDVYQIINLESHKILNVHDADKDENRVTVVSNRKIDNSYRLFSLELQENDCYKIRNLESDKILSVQNEDRVTAVIDDKIDNPFSLFKLEKDDNMTLFMEKVNKSLQPWSPYPNHTTSKSTNQRMIWQDPKTGQKTILE